MRLQRQVVREGKIRVKDSGVDVAAEVEDEGEEAEAAGNRESHGSRERGMTSNFWLTDMTASPLYMAALYRMEKSGVTVGNRIIHIEWYFSLV